MLSVPCKGGLVGLLVGLQKGLSLPHYSKSKLYLQLLASAI